MPSGSCGDCHGVWRPCGRVSSLRAPVLRTNYLSPAHHRRLHPALRNSIATRLSRAFTVLDVACRGGLGNGWALLGRLCLLLVGADSPWSSLVGIRHFEIRSPDRRYGSIWNRAAPYLYRHYPGDGRAAVVKGTAYAAAGALLVIIGFWIKARLEEGFLRKQLGAETYDDYCRRVPMLIPFAPAGR